MICRTWYSAVRSEMNMRWAMSRLLEARRDQCSDVKLAAGKSCRYPAIHLGELVLGEPGVANRPDPPERLAGRVQFETGRVKVALGAASPGEQRPGPGPLRMARRLASRRSSAAISARPGRARLLPRQQHRPAGSRRFGRDAERKPS